MATNRHDVIPVLGDLTAACRDSEAGFRHAANRVEGGELPLEFAKYARQAGMFAGELQNEVRCLGGTRREAPLFDRFANCGWLTVTDKLAGEDTTAVLAECACGMDAAEKSYAAALGKRLPGGVRALVERQHARVKAVRDRVHALAGRHPFGVRPSSRGPELGRPAAPEEGDRSQLPARGREHRQPHR